MKKVILIATILCIVTSSCLTMGGVKKSLFLVDAPKDLVVNNNGKVVKIKKLGYGGKSAPMGSNTGAGYGGIELTGVKIKERYNRI